AALLAGGGTLAFTATRASRAWHGRQQPRTVGRAGALASPGLRTLALAGIGFGLAMGMVEVSVPAFTDRVGAPRAAAGLVLAAFSLGSVLGGLAYGARAWPGSAAGRLALLHLLCGAGVAAAGLAATPWQLGAVLFAAGL